MMNHKELMEEYNGATNRRINKETHQLNPISLLRTPTYPSGRSIFAPTHHSETLLPPDPQTRCALKMRHTNSGVSEGGRCLGRSRACGAETAGMKGLCPSLYGWCGGVTRGWLRIGIGVVWKSLRRWGRGGGSILRCWGVC